MKYKITKEDLNKHNYNNLRNDVPSGFLKFIAIEEKDNNPIFGDEYISKLERKTKRGIYTNIYVLCILGIFCLVFGLFQFIYMKPLIGVNLYTQFPVISNGSIEIVGSVA